MYRILSHSSDSECATDLQKVLKMSISIFRGLATEWLCCTMLMRAGLCLKLPSSMFVSGPVLTLALDGVEKSLMHLWAAISAVSCGSGDPEDPGEESLERDFLIRDSGSK
jgi:hypothetical protein